MNNTAHNLIVLKEAERAIANFETAYKMTSDEMRAAVADDPRVAAIDGFELMDWHFALDQKESILNLIGDVSAISGSATECYSARSYRYQDARCYALVNVEEAELELVA